MACLQIVIQTSTYDSRQICGRNRADIKAFSLALCSQPLFDIILLFVLHGLEGRDITAGLFFCKTGGKIIQQARVNGRTQLGH